MAKPDCGYLTKAKMQSDYRRYNRRYFRGRLPHAELYFSDNVNPISGSRLSESGIRKWEYDTLAETNSWEDIKTKKEVAWEIRFARVFRRQTGRALFRIVLLHEMIHMKPIHYHGKKFKKERHRLVLAGAIEPLI